jgi:hypothetical protein
VHEFVQSVCSLVNCKKWHDAHTLEGYQAYDDNTCCCVPCAACSPYANVVWGPAPADGSFEVITSQQIQEAKEAAAVSGMPVGRLLCPCAQVSVCTWCFS